MGIQLKNNASGTLATAINASDTGVVLTTGNGANFPALGVGDYFYATLESTGGTSEIIKVTVRSGDSLTVVRAQEGTTAQSFAAGSRIELRVTAQSVLDAIDQVTAAQVSVTPYGWIAATNVQAAFEEIVDELDAQQVTYDPPFTGSVPTNVEAKLAQTVSVKDFGAVGDGVTDDTAAIQAAIAAASHVVVPSGTYRCDSMIELDASKALLLDDGATLKRMSAYSSSTDPVIWVKGTYATLSGSGSTSWIESENASPYGIVRLGHENLTVSHDNVQNCTISGLTISGKQQYGQTSGTPDQALACYNPQLGGKVSYFHMIHNLILRKVNTGIGLNGYCNAHYIDTIHLVFVGNGTSSPTYAKAIHMNGCQEVRLTNVFHHFSPDAITVYVNQLDNTGNGGTVGSATFNYVAGLCSEQGGTVEKCFYVETGAGNKNYFQFQANTNGGSTFPTDYYHNNIVISTDLSQAREMRSSELQADTQFLVGVTSSGVQNLTSGGGFQVLPNGVSAIARESSGGGQPVLTLNNTGSADKVLEFRFDGVAKGSIYINGNTACYRSNATTVANLPAASAAGAGATAVVTDATTSTFASPVTGGGSTVVPVYSDGASWRIG